MKIFTGNANPALAREICETIGVPLGEADVTPFPDGETFVQIKENIRGCDVFAIQPTCNPANDHLMELLIMIDAMKRASAKRITAVIPFFGYARQDRKDRPRVPITGKLVANLLTAAGANRVLALDLHAQQIQGFFDIPVDHVYGSKVFLPVLASLNIPNLSIAAPDMGGAKKADLYARRLGVPVVICHKERARANVVSKITAIGEIKDRNIVIVDDMIDTAGTLCKAADVLMDMGAASVRAVATHGVLSGDAVERIHKSALKELYITDTIAHPELADDEKIKIVSMAPVFASIIHKVYNYETISDEFDR